VCWRWQQFGGGSGSSAVVAAWRGSGGIIGSLFFKLEFSHIYFVEKK
jgi:hypothetical protein